MDSLYWFFPISGVKTYVFIPPVVAFVISFLTSIAGVFFYSVIPAKAGMSTAPDWLLGFLFGTNGFFGVYLGARAQQFVPQKFIKLILVSSLPYWPWVHRPIFLLNRHAPPGA